MGTHVIMKKSLAKALLDAGVEHFDAGGPVTTTFNNPLVSSGGSGGNGSITAGGVGGAISGVLGGQNKYQALAPTITTQNFQPQVTNLQGQNQDVYNRQNSLAQALLAQTQGKGPNPAQAALNNATGQNAAATAALIASSRGANANPGLAAELAARQGGNVAQQAVGQGAELAAEQQRGADGALSNLYGNEASNALQGQQIAQQAQAAQNSALTTGQLGAEEANAQIATANANNAASAGGGLLGGLSSGFGLWNKGGRIPNLGRGLLSLKGVQHFDMGGYATPVDPRVLINVPSSGNDDEQSGIQAAGSAFASGLKSLLSKPTGDALSPGVSLGVNTSLPVPSAAGLPGVAPAVPAIPDLMPAAGGAGLTAPELAGLGAAALSRGGEILDYRGGGNVPGKAKVPGDSPKNDTVPALLSPDEEVLPRSVTMAPDAPERAKRFVEALQEKKNKKTAGYANVVKARGTLKDRVARLEKLCGGGMP